MAKATYEKSVDKLLDAYNNGELHHGNCYACAVGTLLGTNSWNYDFLTLQGATEQSQASNTYIGKDRICF